MKTFTLRIPPTFRGPDLTNPSDPKTIKWCRDIMRQQRIHRRAKVYKK